MVESGSEPCLWVADGFVRVCIEVCAPPTEGGVGDDVIFTAAHE